MARLGLAVLLAWAVGPWSGCDRAPVSPPATPPPERAPADAAPPAAPGEGQVYFTLPTRQLG